MSYIKPSVEHRAKTFEQLVEVLKGQADLPIHGDPVIGAYSEAMLELNDSDFRSLFMDNLLLPMNPKRLHGAWTVNNLVLRSVVRCLRRPPEGMTIDFPSEDFDRPETFVSVLPQILGLKGHKVDERLVSDVAWRDVQSNISERYKIFQILGILGLEHAEGATVLDIGCSQNLGLKQLGLGLPFEAITISDATDQQDEHEPAEIATACNRKLLEPDFKLEESYGTDFWTIDDADNKEWVEACTLNPSALRIPGVVDKYKYLQTSAPKNVGFFQSDFSRFDTISYDKRFGMVSLFTVLYQAPMDERREIFDRAVELSNRYVFVMDGAKKMNARNYESPIDQLDFNTAYFNERFGYRFFVFDKFRPDMGLQEILRWGSTRCLEMQLVGRAALA